MKKYYFLFFCYLLSKLSYSQLCDTLILKDGTEQYGIIKEIRIREIVYKKCDFLDGPNYIVEKRDLFLIKYSNGDKEVFFDNKAIQNDVVKSLSGKNITDLNIDEKKSLINQSDCFEMSLKNGEIISCKIVKFETTRTVFKYCDSKKYFTTETIYVDYIKDKNGVIIYFNK
jgi:hypothetical protein